jgi:hypothetical protein
LEFPESPIRSGVVTGSKRRNHLKLKVVVAAASVALIGALLPAAPAAASAGGGALVFTCNATLPSWPSDNGTGGRCDNLASAGAGVHDGSAATFNSLNANVTSYSEPCVAGEPPLVGFASGNATAGGANTVTFNFDWTRVGLAAVVTGTVTSVDGSSHGGTALAAAAFAPLPPLGTCGPNGARPLSAVVAGVGLVALT